MSVSINDVLARLDSILLGKEQAVRMAFCCLLARGHLLIEDIPGVGKTTLAHALAKIFGLEFRRVQFTSDLLPRMFWATPFSIRHRGSLSFIRARSLRKCCWRMK